MVVMAADIRRSTFLMREAIDLVAFAEHLSRFVDEARTLVREHSGWFDKFTGDGFLAYWICDDENDLLQAARDSVLPGVAYFVDNFRDIWIPTFRRGSRNTPTGTGLSVGIDAGPTHIVEVGGDYTIVGPAVVGAVRMVSAAEPDEILCNSYLGSRLAEMPLPDTVVRLELGIRATKEYPSGQEIYRVDRRDPQPGG
jgi:class 3 adenylate cyclase